MDLIGQLLQATEVPLVFPIKWGKDIPATHPIRTLLTHVRLWDSITARLFRDTRKTSVEDAEAKNKDRDLATPEVIPSWPTDTWWWVIAASLSTASGGCLFTDQWRAIYLEQRGGSVDVPPIVDYQVIGDWLKSKFASHPNGDFLMTIVWENAMRVNGQIPAEENNQGKN